MITSLVDKCNPGHLCFNPDETGPPGRFPLLLFYDESYPNFFLSNDYIMNEQVMFPLLPSCLRTWNNNEPWIVSNSAQQAFALMKALSMDDEAGYKALQLATTPAEWRRLSQNTKNFDKDLWDQIQYELMLAVLIGKFAGDDQLKLELIRSTPFYLVEANPHNINWGIGLGPTDPRAQNFDEWKGWNCLGSTLMEVRRQLKVITGFPYVTEEWTHESSSTSETVTTESWNMKNELICQTGTVTELTDEDVVDSKCDMNDIDECISGLLGQGGSLPSLTDIPDDLATPASRGTHMDVNEDQNTTIPVIVPVPHA